MSLNEEDVGAALRDAVRDEPELAFDPDLLIGRARQRRRRRRAMLAVSACVVALVVGTLVLPRVLGTDRQAETAGRAADTTVELSVAPEPAQGGTDGAATPSTGLDEHASTLAGVLHEHLVGLVGSTVERAHDVRARLLSVSPVNELEKSRVEVRGWVYLELDGRRTALSVRTWDTESPGVPDGHECRLSRCERKKLGDGRVLVLRSLPVSGDSDRTSRVAQLRFADGFTIRIGTYNYDPASNDAQPYQRDPLVTDKTLVRLVTAAKLQTFTAR